CSPVHTAPKNNPASTMHDATRPTVPGRVTAERPGNSSGLTPIRLYHVNVCMKPSNETELSTSNRNATPLSGNGFARTSLLPGQPTQTTLPFPKGFAENGEMRAIIPKKIERNSIRSVQG